MRKMRLEIRRMQIAITFVLLIFSEAARWIDVGDHVKRTVQSMSRTNIKRSSALTVRELVGVKEGEDLQETDQGETVEGENIIRYRETFKGIVVYDAYVTVDTDKKTGTYTGRASGNVLSDVSADITSVTPKLSKSEALAIAKFEFKFDFEFVKYSAEKCSLLIYMNNTQAILSYEVSFLVTFNATIKRPVVIIDANRGYVIKSWNKATSFAYKSVGGNQKIGKYTYGDDKPYLNVDEEGGKCSLQSENIKVLDLNFKDRPESGKPFTFDCKKGFTDETNGAYSQLSDAFYLAENVFKMYKSWINMPPVKNTPVIIWVHKGKNEIEASWSGEYMTFGDGNPSFVYPLVSADVVAHEFAHAFTEDHSNLIYNGQFGGINEAFSDVSGEALEYFIRGRNDFIAGGDIFKRGGSRDLCDQSVDGYSITHVNDYTDNLNVHYTSGVYNKVACLMSKSNGLDIQRTFQIFAHANRFYWHERSDFNDAACGIVKAAYDLGYETDTIYSSFSAVGIEACALDDHVRMLSANTKLGHLSGKKGQTLMFKLDLSNVPKNRHFQVLTIGGDGDVDIFVGRRASFSTNKSKFVSKRKGNLELLNIPKKKFRKGYCFLLLTPKYSSFDDVTIATGIVK